MSDRDFFGIPADTWAIFVVAVILGGVGLYTENSGFLMAGAITLVVSLLLVVKKFSKKD